MQAMYHCRLRLSLARKGRCKIIDDRGIESMKVLKVGEDNG